MANTEKRNVSPKEKPGAKSGARPEFVTLSAGQSGEGSPGKEYSNRDSSGTEFKQVTSTIGNK